MKEVEDEASWVGQHLLVRCKRGERKREGAKIIPLVLQEDGHMLPPSERVG